MERLDFKSDDGLRRTCRLAESSKANPEWRTSLKAFLDDVQRASLEERAAEVFQQRLWEDNAVSAVGMGTVAVERVIKDSGFRTWLAGASLLALPEDPMERSIALRSLHEQILQRLEPLCTRMPRLKVFRILAALFPTDFTTIADRAALRRLAILLGLKGGDDVGRHRLVLDRLSEVLGPVDSEDLAAWVRRMTLPWMLVDLTNEEEPDSTRVTEEPGAEKLRPLPATRRRRGLTAMSGYLADMLSVLEFVEDGPSRDELIDFLRGQKPHLQNSSILVYLNAMRSEFNAIRLDADRYTLTERGQALLESGDPDELRDWLLTRVLGFDHALINLQKEPMGRKELYRLLQVANPNWTSDFVPSAMAQWLLHLDLVEKDSSEALSLTARGQAWCEWITWEPESLAAVEEVEATAVSPPVVAGAIRRSPLELIARASGVSNFPEALVADLHLGLWANERRHFAILTGLSGSGKTRLATSYGAALVGQSPDAARQKCTVPVQPGWYDPTPLLGYLNPLTRDSYESTPFLRLLIRAVEHPEEPHVAVLDEMNLSHPEHKLAPVLSAMETGDVLDLHSRGEHFDGVPARIAYPSNLVLIGTVNMDETTLGLSDKVLDRAFTLEFWEIDVDQWPDWGDGRLSGDDEAVVREVLRDLMVVLRPARLHFGWRVISEVVGFLHLWKTEDPGRPLVQALDRVVYSKLLPKLRGEDSPRFREALIGCSEALRKHGLVECQAKVVELQGDLATTGSARFWR